MRTDYTIIPIERPDEDKAQAAVEKTMHLFTKALEQLEYTVDNLSAEGAIYFFRGRAAQDAYHSWLNDVDDLMFFMETFSNDMDGYANGPLVKFGEAVNAVIDQREDCAYNGVE
jgi:hypothetical protein